MRTLSMAALLLVAAIAAPRPAAAQWGGGYGGYYGGYHASTAAEGYYTGLGNVIQAQGTYNLLTSEALNQYEAARAANIKNNVDSANAYFTMRRNQDAYKRERIGPKRTPEDWIRLAEANRDPRLSPGELDPINGAVSWPVLLKTDAFAAPREKLDQIFEGRAKSGGAITPDEYTEAHAAAENIYATLKSQIDTMNGGDYMRCKRFVQELVAELSLPPQ